MEIRFGQPALAGLGIPAANRCSHAATAADIQFVPASVHSILHLEVPLIVQIGSRDMSMKDIMNLAPGTIIELPKSADDDLEILVDRKQIGTGRAVRVGDNFGVRVCYVGDLTARIAALGTEPARDTASIAPVAATA